MVGRRVLTLRQLSLRAFVKAVEAGHFRNAEGHVPVVLPQEVLSSCLALLSRRRRLNSSTLRPFLHNMEHLDLSQASRTIDLVRAVELAPQLTSLVVSGCGVSDARAAALAKVTGRLCVLDVSCNASLSNQGVACLCAANPHLQVLSVAMCSSLASLAGLPGLLPRLQSLDVSNLPLLQELAWPPSSCLESLACSACSSLACLSPLPPSLLRLSCGRCPLLSCLPPLPSSLRSLAAPRLSSSALSSLSSALSSCSSLASLDVSGCSLVSCPPLPPSLRSLALEDCPLLSSLPSSLPPSLQILSLSRSPLALFASCPSSLLALSLAHHPLSDSLFLRLLSLLSSLRQLDVSWCPLSDAVLPAIVAHSSLRLVRLFGCLHISPAAVAAARKTAKAKILAATEGSLLQ